MLLRQIMQTKNVSGLAQWPKFISIGIFSAWAMMSALVMISSETIVGGNFEGYTYVLQVGETSLDNPSITIENRNDTQILVEITTPSYDGIEIDVPNSLFINGNSFRRIPVEISVSQIANPGTYPIEINLKITSETGALNEYQEVKTQAQVIITDDSTENVRIQVKDYNDDFITQEVRLFLDDGGLTFIESFDNGDIQTNLEPGTYQLMATNDNYAILSESFSVIPNASVDLEYNAYVMGLTDSLALYQSASGQLRIESTWDIFITDSLDLTIEYVVLQNNIPLELNLSEKLLIANETELRTFFEQVINFDGDETYVIEMQGYYQVNGERVNASSVHTLPIEMLTSTSSSTEGANTQPWLIPVVFIAVLSLLTIGVRQYQFRR